MHKGTMKYRYRLVNMEILFIDFVDKSDITQNTSNKKFPLAQLCCGEMAAILKARLRDSAMACSASIIASDRLFHTLLCRLQATCLSTSL